LADANEVDLEPAVGLTEGGGEECDEEEKGA